MKLPLHFWPVPLTSSRCRSIPKSWCLRDSMKLTFLFIRSIFSWRIYFKCWFCCSAYSNNFLPCSLHLCCCCWSYLFFLPVMYSLVSLFSLLPVCKTTVNPPNHFIKVKVKLPLNVLWYQFGLSCLDRRHKNLVSNRPSVMSKQWMNLSEIWWKCSNCSLFQFFSCSN